MVKKKKLISLCLAVLMVASITLRTNVMQIYGEDDPSEGTVSSGYQDEDTAAAEEENGPDTDVDGNDAAGNDNSTEEDATEDNSSAEPDDETELPFTDLVEDEWSIPAIKYVYSNRFFIGVDETTFGPELKMTRAMVITVLGRIAEANGEEIDDDAVSDFSDTDVDLSADPNADYFTKYVAWAQENKIVGGYGDNTFRPYEPVTREQLAAIIVRFSKYMGFTSNAENPIIFTDMTSVSDWAIDEVKAAGSAGFFEGYEDGSFRPQNAATRAEVAQVIQNYSKAIG